MKIMVPAVALIVLRVIAPPADHVQLDTREAEQRTCLQRCVSFAAPEFTADLIWIDSEPLTWRDLRGRVVVIQSWCDSDASARDRADEAARLMAGRPDVQVIALHTPRGADLAVTSIKQCPLGVPVAIDPSGAFCDAIGAWERPVNVVVDRHGVVRHAALSPHGVSEVVARLQREVFDPARQAPSRPPDPVEFPAATGRPRGVADLRGRPGPDFADLRYLNLDAPPETDGKVLVVDFWATTCPPCRATIPHLNELADAFRQDIVVLGVSHEQPDAFRRGMTRFGLRMDGFRYPVALDPGGSIARSIRMSSVPQTMVISRDGILRWQGHPAHLTSDVLRTIVDADRCLAGACGPACRRWSATG